MYGGPAVLQSLRQVAPGCFEVRYSVEWGDRPKCEHRLAAVQFNSQGEMIGSVVQVVDDTEVLS